MVLQEVTGPYDLWHYIIHTDELSFCGALGVQFLLRSHAIYSTSPKHEGAPCVVIEFWIL